jgi:hypothetical protein
MREQEEKKLFRTINKIRQMNDCTTEMIVEISQDLLSQCQRIDAEFLTILGAHFYGIEGIHNLVQWKRKTQRTWSKEENCWVACPMTVEEEAFILIRWTGMDISQSILNQTFQQNVQDLQSQFPTKTLILLIEDPDAYFKQKQKENRQEFQAAVRQESIQRRNERLLSRDEWSDVMLWLQYDAQIMVQHSISIADTANFISSFTRNISVLPDFK